MTQGAAQRVTGAEAVDHLHGHRRHFNHQGAVVREHALRPLLDDRETDAGIMQGPRSGQRLPHAHRRLALVEIADRHAHIRQRLLDVTACCLTRGPELALVVQIQDREPAAAVGPQGARVAERLGS